MLFESHQNAVEYMSKKWDRPYPKGSPRSTRIIKNNDQSVSVRYHWTDIITFRPDGITLNTGGYYTVTTKRRMNDCIKATIYQKNFMWYVHLASGETIPFSNHMVITYDGMLKS